LGDILTEVSPAGSTYRKKRKKETRKEKEPKRKE